MHLPKNINSPVLLIAAGSGISPFRSFWVSNPQNPMYLFYGCRSKKDLPFESEIESLKETRRLYPYIAYSRGMKNKLYVQDMLLKKRDLILSLLYDAQVHIYICGSGDMAHAVSNKLLSILCNGNSQYPALPVNQAMKKLIIMKHRNRFITEIFGMRTNEEDTMSFSWKEETSSVVKRLTALEKLNLPRPRQSNLSMSQNSCQTKFNLSCYEIASPLADNKFVKLKQSSPESPQFTKANEISSPSQINNEIEPNSMTSRTKVDLDCDLTTDKLCNKASRYHSITFEPEINCQDEKKESKSENQSNKNKCSYEESEIKSIDSLSFKPVRTSALVRCRNWRTMFGPEHDAIIKSNGLRSRSYHDVTSFGVKSLKENEEYFGLNID